jgi:hypothetical protein
MIRALRDRHRVIVSLLGLTLPVAYLGVVLGRPPQQPARLAATTAAVDAAGRPLPVGPRFTLLDRPRIEAELLGSTQDGEPAAVQVTPVEDPAIPDLLLYWGPTAGDGAALPADATLLGTMRGSLPQTMALPEAGPRGGYLVLYSMGWGRVMSATPLPRRSPP